VPGRWWRLGAHSEYHVARALPCCRTRPSATSSGRGAFLLRNVGSAFSPLACSASLHPALGWGEASRGPCRHEPLPCSTPSRIKVAPAQRKPSCVLHFADQIWLLIDGSRFSLGATRNGRDINGARFPQADGVLPGAFHERRRRTFQPQYPSAMVVARFGLNTLTSTARHSFLLVKM
jgi:hypothetical protein